MDRVCALCGAHFDGNSRSIHIKVYRAGEYGCIIQLFGRGD